MDSDINIAFHLLPPDIRTRAVVAGGAAADLSKASDIDLWILTGAPDPQTHELYKQEIKIELERRNIHLVEPDHPLYADIGGRHHFKVGMVPVYIRPIQIMITPFHTPIELLKSFDLSVHQVGILSTGAEVRLPETTEPGQAIRVTRWDTAHSTLRRYFHLCERYRVRPVWEDVEALAGHVTAAASKRHVMPEAEGIQ